MPDLLLEIGLEEVPARMIASAQAEILKRTLALLTREQLIDPAQVIPADPTTAHTYSTPRRLAVLVRNVLTQQPDITEETTGPAVKIAFKDGVPTPAAEAFARKSGIAVSDLKTITTPKGDYLAATTLKRGRTAAEVLTAELPKEIAALYWAKNMRWIPGSNEKFVRPVLWLVCLLGEEVVPVTFAGRTSGRATYGHRVLSSGEPFEIVTADSYLAQLEGEYVLADVELRRQKIRKALDKITREIPNARWREDEALVDAVTHLTEWPDVLLGNFEPAYLTLPEEVLVTVMRDHQKYFAVEDEHGKLAPHFLTVTNIALNVENAAIIRQGNERVLRARFNDARFFWEFDQRTPLTARVKLLENVTFQKDLGSYAKKSERVATLMRVFAISAGADPTVLESAAPIAKTDLTTELVKEFTELQGIIGGLYARSQGFSEAISSVIYDQYLPKNMEDRIPRTVEGCVYGLSDRMDTICSMFHLGIEPTSSKDPHGLRRAANSAIKILAEANLAVTFDFLITMSSTMSDFGTQERIKQFMLERLEFYLRDVLGNAYDTTKAVLGANRSIHISHSNDPLAALAQMSETDWTVSDIVARAKAISNLRTSEDFLAVCTSFRRMKNILIQAEEKAEPISTEIRTGHFQDSSENQLEANAGLIREKVDQMRREKNYSQALIDIATLRPYLDAFFESVMVMAPEPEVRANRLALLTRLLGDFRGIADFSEIVTAG